MGKTISLPCKAHLYILIQRRAKLAPPTRSGGPLLMLPVVRETFDKTLNRVCVEFLNIYLRVCVLVNFYYVKCVYVRFGGFVLNFAAYFRVVLVDDYYQRLESLDVHTVLNINSFVNIYGIKF